jgi:hypothetical protein
MSKTRDPRSDAGVAHRVNWRFVRSTIVPLLLPIWFVIYAIQTFVHFSAHDAIGVDLAIYRHAAEVAIGGGNPWIPDPGWVSFAAPPPTLLLYVPVTLMPLPLATVVMMSAGVLGAAWAIRRLHLPLWWLLFPPLFDALIVGNPDALVLALLLVRGPLAGLAAVLKVYALLPLLLQRRWVALVLAGAVGAFSLPQLPNFLAAIDIVRSTLDTTAKLSAWGTVFIIPVIVALWFLRRRGAEYLVVPTLWPNTQSHYGTMALPAIHPYPVAAALIGLNTPLVPPLAVIVMAVEDWLRNRQEAEAEAPDPAQSLVARDAEGPALLHER